MKMILILLLSLCIVVSAGVPYNIVSDITLNHRIIVIDKCEYIVSAIIQSDTQVVFTHKGNCKYCAERENQIIKLLIKICNKVMTLR